MDDAANVVKLVDVVRETKRIIPEVTALWRGSDGQLVGIGLSSHGESAGLAGSRVDGRGAGCCGRGGSGGKWTG